jgi:rubrerythrin
MSIKYEHPESYEALVSSLWKCEVCETFVSIHSTKLVLQAMCPTCAGGQLKFCGTFDNIMGTSGAA